MMSLNRSVQWAALVLALSASQAAAQGAYPSAQGPYSPPGAYPPGAAAPAQNPVCTRLEAQLAAIDRGAVDPARADMLRRYEDAVARQQADLDNKLAQSRRLGCEGGGFFSLFSGQNPQCVPLNQQIAQIRGNLDRMLGELQQNQAGGGAQESQRQTVIAALAQANCGPQYRAAANQQRGFFDTLFGGNRGMPQTDQSGFFGAPDGSATFRTVCVRTCDGYYFPVSFATSQARFAEDEQSCQRLCPASEVMLFSYRNPGEDMTQAVAADGRLYSTLPNAFKYRTEFNPTCSCRRAGQSWADAMGTIRDTTVERGDIVVTEERAKAMQVPRDAQGRPIKPPATPTSASPPATNAPADQGAQAAPADGKKTIRSVGPIFVPAR